MNHLKIIAIFAINITVTLFANAAPPQDSAYLEKNKQMIATYLHLKESLVASNFSQVKENAVKLNGELKTFRLRGLTLVEMKRLQGLRDTMRMETDAITQAPDIKTQREHFFVLSKALWQTAQTLQLTNKELVLQECPMTHEQWLSDTSAIANPYQPETMLTCGFVANSLTEKNYQKPEAAACH